MPIKTELTPEQLMKLNPWIKTLEQAKKILEDVRTKPHASLMASLSSRGSKFNSCGVTVIGRVIAI